MSKAPILEHDTWLYSAEAPAGRLFAAGVLHPGDGWGDEPLAAQAASTGDTSDAANSTQAALDAQKVKFDEAWEELAADHDKALAEVEKLKAENAELREAIAKFDPDGDGKPGGSKPKPDKAS